eukprot:9998050-Heterocapsa_arctica.AAC.1
MEMGISRGNPKDTGSTATASKSSTEKVTPPSRKMRRQTLAADPENTVLPLPIDGLSMEESRKAWEVEMADLLTGMQ